MAAARRVAWFLLVTALTPRQTEPQSFAVSLPVISRAFPHAEPLTADNALVEIVRRIYGSPLRPASEDEVTARLLAPLTTALDSQPAAPSDAVPSLMPPARWRELLGGDGSLFRRIALDRNAVLLYHGLARMDAASRAFLSDRPALIARIYRDHAPVFAAVSRSFRVTNGAMLHDTPDWEKAAWRKIAGAAPDDAERFIGKLLEGDRGRLAHLFDAVMAVPGAAAFVMETPALAERNLSSLRESLAALDRDWRPDLRPFVRPPADLELILESAVGVTVPPAMLNRAFDDGGRLPAPDRINAPWIGAALLRQPPSVRRARLDTLAFAQRAMRDATPRHATDVEAALRGRFRYPAPFSAMERAGLLDTPRLAAVARRLDAFPHGDGEAYRGFQAAFALVMRAAASGGISRARAGSLVDGLLMFPSTRPRPAGWLTSWLTQSWLRSPVLLSADDNVVQRADAVTLALVAGRHPDRAAPATVSWEGDEYDVDPWRADFRRYQAVRARQSGPSLEEALACRERACETAIDDALVALVYATALGSASGPVRLVPDLHLRHDFGASLPADGPFGRLPWSVPAEQPAQTGQWNVRGSLIELDVALARHALKRLRQDVMPLRPTMTEVMRHRLALVPVLMRPEDLRTALAERLALELDRLRLPSALLPALLAVVTTDLVEGAKLGYPDDEHAIRAWVSRLAPADVADYVSSLTADGPLIPKKPR